MASPPAGDPRARRSAGELALRVASALVLAPLAVAVAYLGGGLFIAMWVAAGVGMLWEWAGLALRPARAGMAALGAVAFAGAGGLLHAGRPGAALLLLLAAAAVAAGVARFARQAPGWAGAGVLYAGAVVAAPVLLRGADALGLAAIVLLFVVVWATDIAAYFGGRALGGPKLWPAVSPKKTWSGALVGAAAAVAGGVLVARAAGLANLAAIGVLAFVLSVAAQAGDFFESAVKRRFGAKDSGTLIPGHGGLMDRLDGFVAAALLAAAVGVARGGLAAPSRGLLIW